jgi:hypothetical protein
MRKQAERAALRETAINAILIVFIFYPSAPMAHDFHFYFSLLLLYHEEIVAAMLLMAAPSNGTGYGCGCLGFHRPGGVGVREGNERLFMIGQ